MTVFKDICHGEEYGPEGDTKMKWTKVGTLIEKDGKQYVKLQFIPVSKGEIFLSVFEPKQQGQQQGGQQQAPAKNSGQPDFNSVPADSDIPF